MLSVMNTPTNMPDKRTTPLDSLAPFAPNALEIMAGHKSYQKMVPYPHVVMDGFFQAEALDKILEEWPRLGETDFISHNDGTYTRRKTASSVRTALGPHTKAFIHRLGEPDFLMALEQMTGIPGLIPDPYLDGGGLHQTQAGGKLAVHADFNQHPKLKLDRRLNLLIYLNKDWREENQGWFEIWDTQVSACVRRFLPVFNRMAIFSTSDTSYHGQPEEIVGPPELFRRSIALYYYTNGRPENEIAQAGRHYITMWKERPGAGY